MPSKLNILLDKKMTFADMPVIGPASAQALRTYIADCEPPTALEHQINRMLARLATALPSQRLSDDEAEERMAIYRRALTRHALVDLREAFEAILRTCRFFPTIAEIEEIVAPIRARRMARVNRADMLISKHEREWRPPVESLIDPSEINEIMRLGGGSPGRQSKEGGFHG